MEGECSKKELELEDDSSWEEAFLLEIQSIELKYKNKVLKERLFWVIGILTVIIIILLAGKFKDNNSVESVISIASGLVSIALAIVAIAITFKQEIDSNNVNRQMMLRLESLNKSIGDIEHYINSFKELNNIKIDSIKEQLTTQLTTEGNLQLSDVEKLLDQKLKRVIASTSRSKSRGRGIVIEPVKLLKVNRTNL